MTTDTRIHRRRRRHARRDRRRARRRAATRATPTLDWSLNDGILEIECEDGSKLIVNRHVPNREIWVAARSGGFHFRARGRRVARHALGRGRSPRSSRAPARSRRARRRPVARCRRRSRVTPRIACGLQPPTLRPLTPPAAPSSLRARAAARRVRACSVSTIAQKRGEWLSSTRCATSCATTYSASAGGSCTSRQLRRISPRALQLPHSLRALDRRTAGVARRDARGVAR